jgi:ribosomal protein S3AE
MVEKKGAKGRRKTVDKWKKKSWYTIVSSKTFSKKPLCETPAEKAHHLENRTYKITLDRLTGQRMRRDVSVYFKYDNVQGQTINTKVSKFEVTKSTLGRLIRRRNSKVASFVKIGVVGGDARVSVVVVTGRKATQRQKTSIRAITDKEIDTLKGKDFEAVVEELLLGKFAGVLAKKAAKICIIKKVVVSKATFTKAK